MHNTKLIYIDGFFTRICSWRCRFQPLRRLRFFASRFEAGWARGSFSWDFALPFFNTRLALPSPTQKLGLQQSFPLSHLGVAAMHMQLISLEAPVIHTCQGLNASSPPSSPSPPSRTHRILQSSQPLPRNNSIPTSTTLY